MVAAISKAQTSKDFVLMPSNQDGIGEGTRLFGRRLILKNEAYQSGKVPSPTDLEKRSWSSWGVYELSSSSGSPDYRVGRKIFWVNDLRWWNVSKLIWAARKGKQPAILTKERGITHGGYYATDLVGQPRDKNGRLILVREIHQNDSLLMKAGIARVDNGKLIASVEGVNCLLPDSGAEINEISYRLAEKLGLTNGAVTTAGPTVTTSTGSYETLIAELTFQINGNDLKGFKPRFQSFQYPSVIRKIPFAFPKVKADHTNSWDILIGACSAAKDFGLTLEFVP